MWTLARMLPLMIGHLIPNEEPHWNHYLQLLDIVDIIFSPAIRPGIPSYLEVLIEENLEEFTELYSSPVIPKMHYLIHIPRFLSKYSNISSPSLHNLLCSCV